VTARLAVLALGLALLAAPAGAAEPAATVEVRSNRFAPTTVSVPVGATVEWVAVDGNHDVRADDGSFHFHPARTLVPGERVTRTFDRDQTVYFHCTLHGAPGGLGMAGVIVVGDGDPLPPPGQEAPQITVPTDTPSLRTALQLATPGTIINVEPGTYREALGVTKPQVVIRGTGDGPEDVVIDGSGHRPVGISILADNVTIANLTVADHAEAGILFAGVTGYRADAVAVRGPSRWGIHAESSRGGVLRAVTASGATGAGIAITGCDPCDAVVAGATVTGNRWGMLVEGGAGVVIRGSQAVGNGAGIVLRSPLGGQRQLGAHVTGNVVEGNLGLVGDAGQPPFDVPAGIGIWVAGGQLDTIERNTVSGNRWGIAVTAQGRPGSDTVVRDNLVGGSVRADLGWDGLGSGTCFTGNRTPEGAEPSSDPPAAQTLYDCGLPLTVGVPSPAIHADLGGVGLPVTSRRIGPRP
jgi:parallel beta-helix repeat protein